MSRSVFDEQDKVKALKGLVSALPREGDARTPAPPRYGQGGFCRDVPDRAGYGQGLENGRGGGIWGSEFVEPGAGEAARHGRLRHCPAPAGLFF